MTLGMNVQERLQPCERGVGLLTRQVHKGKLTGHLIDLLQVKSARAVASVEGLCYREAEAQQISIKVVGLSGFKEDLQV